MSEIFTVSKRAFSYKKSGLQAFLFVLYSRKIQEGEPILDEREFNFLLKALPSDVRALEKLHAFYYRRILYHLGKKYGRSFAEDVAQEFFLWLLHTDITEHVAFPTTWVYLKCDDLAKTKLRQERRYSYRDDLSDVEREEVWKQELYGDLYDAVKALDPVDQAIVDLYYWEGYKLREIAPLLHLSESTVRQRHRRLLKKIKKFLNTVTF